MGRRATSIDALPSVVGLFSEGLPGILRRPVPTLDEERAFITSYVEPANSVLLMACHESAILGLLDFRGNSLPELAHSGIFGVSVARLHRGHGVGSALIRALLDWAPAHGIERVEVHAWQNNPRALALYERFGFEREGILRHAVIRDGVPIDVIVLARLLVA